ncbi:hypothetical protein QUB63_28090 [Microcoleus sp. ARI1-B5]|uniref:hypothetical protein n=1 Tax=unclassified Microcoleus TaxID=2642155 RepID=UPI002FD15084
MEEEISHQSRVKSHQSSVKSQESSVKSHQAEGRKAMVPATNNVLTVLVVVKLALLAVTNIVCFTFQNGTTSA